MQETDTLDMQAILFCISALELKPSQAIRDCYHGAEDFCVTEN